MQSTDALVHKPVCGVRLEGKQTNWESGGCATDEQVPLLSQVSVSPRIKWEEYSISQVKPDERV